MTKSTALCWSVLAAQGDASSERNRRISERLGAFEPVRGETIQGAATITRAALHVPSLAVAGVESACSCVEVSVLVRRTDFACPLGNALSARTPPLARKPSSARTSWCGRRLSVPAVLFILCASLLASPVSSSLAAAALPSTQMQQEAKLWGSRYDKLHPPKQARQCQASPPPCLRLHRRHKPQSPTGII